LRKRAKNHIERAEGWPGLAKSTLERKEKYGTGQGKYQTSPLILFSRLLKMRYSGRGNKPVVKMGFFNTKSWFKAAHGIGAATIAELHEKGGSGKYGSRPLRAMIEPIWRKEGGRMNQYIQKKFYSVFFSSKKPGLKY
jgi:hypothetical protein